MKKIILLTILSIIFSMSVYSKDSKETKYFNKAGICLTGEMIRYMQYSESNNKFYFVSGHGNIRFINERTGELEQILGLPGYVTSSNPQFVNDSVLVVFLSEDTLGFYNYNQQTIISKEKVYLDGSAFEIEDNTLLINNNNQCICVANYKDYKPSLILWNYIDKTVIDVLADYPANYPYFFGDYFINNKFLVYCVGSSLFLYDLNSKEKKIIAYGSIHNISISKDSKYISYCFGSAKKLEIYSIEEKKVIYTFEGKHSIYSAVDFDNFVFAYYDKEINNIKIVDILSNKIINQFVPLLKIRPTYMAFDNDNNLIFANNGNEVYNNSMDLMAFAQVYNTTNGKLVNTLIANNDYVSFFDISNNNMLYYGYKSNHNIKVMDLETGNLINSFPIHLSTIETLDKHPDIEVSYDNKHLYLSVSSSRIQKIFLTENKSIFVDLESQVLSLETSPVNNNIAAGFWDGNVIIYDESFNILKRKKLSGCYIRELLYSKSGDTLYLAIYNDKKEYSKLYQWDLNSDDLDEIKELQLMPNELHKYRRINTSFNSYIATYSDIYDFKNKRSINVAEEMDIEVPHTSFSVSKCGDYVIPTNKIESGGREGIALYKTDFIETDLIHTYDTFKGNVTHTYIGNAHMLWLYGKPIHSIFLPESKDIITFFMSGAITKRPLYDTTITDVQDIVREHKPNTIYVQNSILTLPTDKKFFKNNYNTLRYSIYDISGVLLKKQQVNELSVDFNYPQGIYFLSIEGNSYQETYKIVNSK